MFRQLILDGPFFDDVVNFIVMIVIDLFSVRNTGRYGMTTGMTKVG